jgi:hypothetical protein
MNALTVSSTKYRLQLMYVILNQSSKSECLFMYGVVFQKSSTARKSGGSHCNQ